MDGITVLVEKKLDFALVYKLILKAAPNTSYKNNTMSNGKSSNKWYFYNLIDMSNEVFDEEDLKNLPNKSMYCYELSFRSVMCPLYILDAIKEVDPSTYIYDDIADKFMKIDEYIESINEKMQQN
ncbi:MAG: hypothetical protein SO007_06095 [Candidatus Enteromonas sp.]|nr:hypothetical protein [Candidatus Enteromonas sp.]